MSSWGPGNFQNNTAGEYLYEIVQPLLTQIETTLQNPAAIVPDKHDGIVMICNIEILASLAEGLGKEAGLIDLLPPAMIKAWRDTYLKAWDQGIDALKATTRHKTRRRAVIVHTFQRLIDASSSGRRDFGERRSFFNRRDALPTIYYQGQINQRDQVEGADKRPPFWVVAFWFIFELLGAMTGVGGVGFYRRKLPGSGATLLVILGILTVIGLIVGAVYWKS